MKKCCAGLLCLLFLPLLLWSCIHYVPQESEGTDEATALSTTSPETDTPVIFPETEETTAPSGEYPNEPESGFTKRY